MSLTAIVVSCVLTLLPIIADDQADAVRVKFYNATDRPVEVWLNDHFIGLVSVRSVAEHTAKLVDGKPDLAITAIAGGAELPRLNANVAAVVPGAQVAAVWGAVAPPRDLVPAAVDASLPAMNAELFTQRWKTLSAHRPGKPFRLEDTLLGSKWKDMVIRGEVLAIHSDQSSTLINSVGMLFVKVPKGDFEIAQQGGVAGRKVTISRDYYMASTEVTQAQWAVVNGGRAQGLVEDGLLPATSLSWQQASDWCAKLSDAPGWTYRLPTEAQWEYACRAGKTGPFHPPGVPVSQIMWYSANSGRKPHRVGQLRPNQLGLFDMHGNVREWCRDAWSPTPSVGVDPAGPVGGVERVRRGGAYDVPQQWCGCGARDSGTSSVPQPWCGFRVVLEEQPR